jgi:hypothetical protein
MNDFTPTIPVVTRPVHPSELLARGLCEREGRYPAHNFPFQDGQGSVRPVVSFALCHARCLPRGEGENTDRRVFWRERQRDVKQTVKLAALTRLPISVKIYPYSLAMCKHLRLRMSV